MIKATHHWFLFPFFFWYGILKMKLHFKKIKLSGDFNDKGLPVIIVANHFSWWDGFIVGWLVRKKIHRKIFIMMEEEPVAKTDVFQ